MLMAWLAIIGGFALLMWSAERFVLGGSALARNLGVSPLVIGMVVMGFGTSLPEMLVSGIAASNGNPALGIGNAIGSNIANIGLVLGITALIVPLTVASGTLKREYPVLFGVMLLAGVLLWDGDLSRMDGIILFSGFFLVMGWMVWQGMKGRKDGEDPLVVDLESEIPTDISTGVAVMWGLLGLVILVASSRLLVWGAVEVAHSFGVSDLIIGLTIVAIGTSLPELAASVMSALKGEDDMAVGNVLGSNMFNLLAVLALPGLILPSTLDAALMQRDFPIMIGLTIALFAMAYGFRGPGRINRIEGALLLTAFIAYMVWLGRTSLA
ncbi:Inner membrane protein YrbG, predicted calcium/sodium:proton antiporter [hydrothermal vent metagenome]|uniref:Inner membrane protein YrbG, predicted calcium/sodium:proton antiporter n=1 Tax=hydrothermal vent metagenome TaxID=652676 RepID=A0A3B1B1P3_9ZZZZ